MIPLPLEILKLIKTYASDRTDPTPTSLLMKELHFNYQAESHEPRYWPERLVVTIRDHAATTTFAPSSNGTHYSRRYFLYDFLPSYWSDYANTYDSHVLDHDDLLRRLRWNDNDNPPDPPRIT